jgi:hypothetical protein
MIVSQFGVLCWCTVLAAAVSELWWCGSASVAVQQPWHLQRQQQMQQGWM